ncbi:substrate-binding periplasmic protein [Shewanella sp. HL-SH2]|uniref:substrate-binding periplasmic protein n=1 Tax=Shewanella sp. HL-SH2 TaxID=3436238 RepID=UPI003EBEFBA8
MQLLLFFHLVKGLLARLLLVLSVVCLLSLFSTPTVLAKQTKSQSSTVLKFCIEDTEFPPFNYFIRENGKPTAVSDGYDIELLALVFSSTAFEYEIQVRPWVRCLHSLRNGSIDAAMSASLNAKREIDFRASEAYYYLTPSYFYLKSSFISEPIIEKLEDLSKYGQVCGIKGFNYVQFGWPPHLGLIETPYMSHLSDMLKKNRCKFFLDRKESFYGTLALKQHDLIPPDLVSRPTPNNVKESFHMLVSRKSLHQDMILSLFNASVRKMESSGELAKLLNKHQQKIGANRYTEE